MNEAQTQHPPWYKQRWPWVLITLPLISVCVSSTLAYFAVTTWDGLVVDDYYRQGRAIDRTIARSVLAADLGLSADTSFRSDKISVRLTADDTSSFPATLIMTIAHPTRSGQDQILRLYGDGGLYSSSVTALTIGRWNIQIEDEHRTWRLNGAVYLPTDTEKRIVPYDS